MCSTCVYPSTHPLHCEEQVLQHSTSGSSRPDEWILMRVRFPGSQTGHICLRFHLEARSPIRRGCPCRIRGQITLRHAPLSSFRPSQVIFGHFGASRGNLRTNFTHRNITGLKSKVKATIYEHHGQFGLG